MTIIRLLTVALSILTQPRGIHAAHAAVSAVSCPQDVESAGEDPGNWTLYNDWNQFLACNEKPRLFTLDASDSDDTNDSLPSGSSWFRSCVSLRGEIMETLEVPWNETLTNDEEHSGDIRVSWSSPSEDAIPGQAAAILLEMSAYISINTLENIDNSVSLFGHFGDTAVGIYIGEYIDKAGAVYAVLQQAILRIREQGVGASHVFQYCDPGQPRTSVGIFVDTSGGEPGLLAVQEAVGSWDLGDCAPELDNSDVVEGVSIWVARDANLGLATTSESSTATTTSALSQISSSASPSVDSTSRIINSTSSTNSSSTRGLRRRAPPSRNSDGSCASYLVARGETCDSIAKAHELEADDITKFNINKSWGFKECKGMPYDIYICLSEGNPPLPPSVEGLQCGPQVPGTEMPTNGMTLADLNPCPLNVCCSQFGFCGTTDEFCEVTGDVPGVSGCLSNCERGITNNRETPSEFIKIGYFEAWNGNRPCLNVDIDDIDTQSFTHIHFAFGKITPEFGVDMGGDIEEPFQKFVKLKGIKRIVSFGGWADSTEPDRFWIFREAVEPKNRPILAENLVNLVKEYDLDGIDIDWEYPAAPDIPDIPSGQPVEGENHLGLIALLRLLLPAGKTLSIAAPASYWYLKGIPIKDMSEYLDYIVYMTYDLHGQWDTDSKFSQPGCTDGDCLRSHVNYTETIDSLSMITRAGVPAAKIIVGVTSYGRSFLMAEAGCTGPMCHYLGDKRSSPAKKGPCTGEGGYIANAEIDMIIKSNPNAETWYDGTTMTNYLVYDDVQWVAYMDSKTKATRTSIYRALNFGGVTDWAVDLESFGANEFMSPGVYAEISKGGGSCPWTFADGFSCSDLPIKEATSMEKDERWDGLNTGCAWRDVVREWKDVSDGTSFPDYVSDYFAGETPFRCQTINDCGGESVNCPTADKEDSGPAGQFILESFIRLNQILGHVFNALNSALTDVDFVTENFIADFASPPEKKDLRMFNMGIDIVGLGLSMFFAPVFNNVMKVGTRTTDNIRDNVFSLTSWGLSLAKDAQKSDEREKEIELKIRDEMKDWFKTFRDAVSETNKQLFSGKDDTVNHLFTLIDEGTLITGKTTEAQRKHEDLLAEDALQKQAEKAAYAQMIPRAWYLAGWRPVVVDGGKCDDVGAVESFMATKTADDTHVCHRDRRYYLVAASRPWEQGTPVCYPESPPQNGSPPGCWSKGETPRLEKLPGNDKLGDTTYGNLTLSDIVIGSVETWRNNNEKNGAKALDYTQRSEAERLLNSEGDPINVRAAGVFRIPVCTAKEAWQRWKEEGKKWPDADDIPESFPCP